ncbi:hypothetical protein CR969_00760 [Candidatus Saccharibacteria bacterium]|nr:MAG: hypothetical protein CR969_00760 [Candidatus Saccharibacteria bacterium]
MLFLSLGSNYRFKQAWHHLWARGKDSDSQELIQELTDRYQAKQTLLFSQGRAALSEAVRLATGGQGLVAVNSLTCFVVIEAIKTAGCQPLYVDIEAKNWHFKAETLKQAIKGKDVRAVIVQNTIGMTVDIDQILELAKQANLAVIEDLAHAVGGYYDQTREIGTVGDYTMLSFGRDKMLDTINGGALVIRTDQPKAEIKTPHNLPSPMQRFRDRIYPMIGWKSRVLFGIGVGKLILALAYKLKLAVRSADGGNHPDQTLTNWQAKLALEQIRGLDQAVKNKLEVQSSYLEKLAKFNPQPSSNGVRLPLLVEDRTKLIEALKQNGIMAADMWYEVPISPARLYDKVGFPENQRPNATLIAQHTVNLPTHQLVSAKDIEKISQIVLAEAKPWSL